MENGVSIGSSKPFNEYRDRIAERLHAGLRSAGGREGPLHMTITASDSTCSAQRLGLPFQKSFATNHVALQKRPWTGSPLALREALKRLQAP